MKRADLEDRLRRNNIKIPESIKPPDLNQYFTNTLQEALPEASLEDLIIDHFHRLPKPKHISGHLARDTIVRIHLYADVSAFTMQQHRQLTTITKLLHNHCISYRWLYPARLLITKNDATFVVAIVKEELCLLKDWNITEPLGPNDAPGTSLMQSGLKLGLHCYKVNYLIFVGPGECHIVFLSLTPLV